MREQLIRTVKKKEKVEIKLILLRLACGIRSSRLLEYQKQTPPKWQIRMVTRIRIPLRGKGKGSSGRHDLCNFVRAAKISCAMIDLLQCWTRKRRKLRGEARFQLD